MNNVLSKKYGLSPAEIERRSLSNEKFGTLSKFLRIAKTRQVHERLNRFDKENTGTKKKKLRDKLNIGEKVLVLAERIKKYLCHGNSISSQYKILPILTVAWHFQSEKDKLLIGLITTGS